MGGSWSHYARIRWFRALAARRRHGNRNTAPGRLEQSLNRTHVFRRIFERGERLAMAQDRRRELVRLDRVLVYTKRFGFEDAFRQSIALDDQAARSVNRSIEWNLNLHSPLGSDKLNV